MDVANKTQEKNPDAVCGDTKTILDILKKFNLPITLKDLKQPTLDTIITIYKGILEACLFVKMNTHDMDPSEVIIHFQEDVVKNQSESFRFLQIYMLVNYFYDLMGVSYNFLEIFNPPKKLFHKQLGQIINFARFEFGELHEFGDVQNRNKIYLEKCDALKKEIDTLKGQIFALKSESNEKRPLIDAVKKRISHYKERLNNIKDQRNKLKEKNDLAKKEEDTIINEKNDLTSSLEDVQKKLNFYDKLLIRSPERLRKDMEKNEARIQDLDKVVKLRREEIDAVKQDVHERIKFIDGVNSIIESYENFYQSDVLKANSIIKEIEKEKEECTNLTFNLKELQNTIHLLTQEKEKLELKVQKKHQDVEQRLTACKQKDENLRKKIEEGLNQITNLEQEQNRLKDEKEKYIKQSQELMALGLRQIEAYQIEEGKIVAKHKSEENFMNNIQREAASKMDQVKKAQQNISDFLDRATEEFLKTGTINFENFNF